MDEATHEFDQLGQHDLDDEQSEWHSHDHNHPPSTWKHGPHDVQDGNHSHYHSRSGAGPYDHHPVPVDPAGDVRPAAADHDSA